MFCDKFKVVTQRVKAWYERAESFGSTVFSEMKPFDMKEPLHTAGGDCER